MDEVLKFALENGMLDIAAVQDCMEMMRTLLSGTGKKWKIIHECNLTPKGFSNFRTLIYGIFKFARKKRLVDFSITEVMGDIEVSRKAFRRIIKTDEEQVFMEDELPKVTDYLEQNQDILNLGILLMFKTGLRIEELAGLKKCDVSCNVIHVNRTGNTFVPMFSGTG